MPFVQYSYSSVILTASLSLQIGFHSDNELGSPQSTTIHSRVYKREDLFACCNALLDNLITSCFLQMHDCDQQSPSMSVSCALLASTSSVGPSQAVLSKKSAASSYLLMPASSSKSLSRPKKEM